MLFVFDFCHKLKTRIRCRTPYYLHIVSTLQNRSQNATRMPAAPYFGTEMSGEARACKISQFEICQACELVSSSSLRFEANAFLGASHLIFVSLCTVTEASSSVAE